MGAWNGMGKHLPISQTILKRGAIGTAVIGTGAAIAYGLSGRSKESPAPSMDQIGDTLTQNQMILEQMQMQQMMGQQPYSNLQYADPRLAGGLGNAQYQGAGVGSPYLQQQMGM